MLKHIYKQLYKCVKITSVACKNKIGFQHNINMLKKNLTRIWPAFQPIVWITEICAVIDLSSDFSSKSASISGYF
jgi:hypothetical protein